MNNLADSLFQYSKSKSFVLYQKSLELAKSISYTEGIIQNHYFKAFNLFDSNYNAEALEEFKICIKYIPKMEAPRKISCLDALAYIHYTVGDYKSSIAYYKKVIENYEIEGNSEKIISEYYTKIGNAYLAQEKYYSAQEMYLKSLQYAKKTNDIGLLSDCYVNIGIVKNSFGNYRSAKEFSFKALKIIDNKKNLEKLAIIMANIAKIYYNEKKDDSAMIYLFKGLDYLKDHEESLLKANILSDISQINANHNNYDSALTYAFEAKRINYKINNYTGYYWDLLNISKIYLKNKKNLKITKIYLDSVHYAANQLELVSLLNSIYYEYARYYYYMGNIDSSNYYWEKNSDLSSKIYQNNIQNVLGNLDDRFRLEKKISDQKLEQYKQQKELFTYIIASVALLVIFLIVSTVIWIARRKSEKLLLNVLPKTIAKRLKSKENPIADKFESASIVFIDIAHFTYLSKYAKPERIVEVLNNIYTTFDQIAEKYGLEKIKTIGDCYMAASGVPIIRDDHAEVAMNFALEAMKKMEGYDTGDGTILNFRCGIDCGPIVAGVIGEKKFIYDLWGDTVNTASRMEEFGVPGKIQVTERFKKKLEIRNEKLGIKFEERGEIDIKGKGKMKTYFLIRN
jgi:class 3 adenylate cyclase/tetratricopeptide (TPR) repeat protein